MSLSVGSTDLQTPRYPTVEDQIRIDAICINQADIGERSRQVGILMDVFGFAQCTIVWLEQDDDDTVLVIELLEHIAMFSVQALQ